MKVSAVRSIIVVLALCLISSPVIAIPSMVGDVNEDGELNSLDADLITMAIAAGGSGPIGDITGDGVVTLLDLDVFFENYSSFNGVPLAVALVDVNFDMVNTSADYYIIRNNQGLPLTAFTAGNLLVDGFVNAADLSLYLSRGGVIPEPATGLLLAGLILVPLASRRRYSAVGELYFRSANRR